MNRHFHRFDHILKRIYPSFLLSSIGNECTFYELRFWPKFSITRNSIPTALHRFREMTSSPEASENIPRGASKLGITSSILIADI